MVAALLERLGQGGRERGLAEARWRLDDGKSLGREFGQDGEEPRTRDQPPESCRHDLGRQKWHLSSAGQGARSICKMARVRLDQGLPLIPVSPPPIRGMPTMTKVYDLCQRVGSAGHGWLQAFRRRSRSRKSRLNRGQEPRLTIMSKQICRL